MKPSTLLTSMILSAAPSLLLAQPNPPSPRATVASRPTVAVAPVPATALEAPPVPTALEGPQPPEAPQTATAPQPPEAPQPPNAPQTATAPQPPNPPKAYTATVAPTPPAAPAAPRTPTQMLNVQIEVTLSDSKGSPKTVVLTVADGELGQNRTSSAIQSGPNLNYQNFGLNADARPHISGNKIRLYLSAEATFPASSDAKTGTAANITLKQSQTLILNDGDSVEIARAADPVSDRAFVLSVKVKIQR